MNNLMDFLEDYKNKVFYYAKYKKVYTPYEQEKKYSDELIYEDCFLPVRLSNAWLINNDILLELEEMNGDGYSVPVETSGRFVYVKLSDISLRRCEEKEED